MGKEAGETAKLHLRGVDYELPVIEGTEGEVAVDIRRLRRESGCITYDPGLANTGSCLSEITFLDGEKGILRYCGYPIEELAEHSSFLEVAWLLIYRALPTQRQLDGFTRQITYHTMLHEDLKRFFSAFPKSGHPMAISAATVGALSTFYQDVEFDDPADKRWAAAIRLLAKVPTIAAYAYKHSIGQPMLYPRNDLSYTENILYMMFATPCEEYVPDPVVARALDLLLVLHADHEQNCSTSTVRVVGSSLSNLFASVSAGIMALWGPLHGGANQKVIEMLISIHEGERSAKEFMERAKDRESGTRLMGFGHRVYKNYDPRARILKKACHDLLDRVGTNSPLLEIALELEDIALHDDYFIERSLYPNVDFYSGLIYQALKIPVDMFTVFFALGRLPGWISQWLELHRDNDRRISRPRQIYTGFNQRSYVPVDERSSKPQPARATR